MDTALFESFSKVVHARRSARAYLPEPIPEHVLEACLDLAIAAPSSHNLEIWRFVVIKDSDLRKRMVRLCLDQNSVRQAPTLIVVVARPDQWKLGCKKMLEHLRADLASETIDETYRHWLPLLVKKYEIMVPLLFTDGPFHAFAPLKSFLLWTVGIFRPMMRGPFGRSEQQMWAIKTAALACENFMLALSAAGYDSCPIEGFDEPGIKRALSLPSPARVVMVITAGRRGPGALIPQIRFEKSHYIQSI